VTGGGSPTRGGSGNGTPPRANPFATTPLYQQCRAWIEARYPRLVKERFFESLEAYMVVLDVEEGARRVGGSESTWFLTTPDDMSPFMTIYFTYRAGQIVLQAVWADE
jgi:hypothetical protein